MLLAGCGREAGWYALPPQQSLDLGPDPGGVGAAVTMGDANADDYIVRDVGRAPGVWRWAFRHPELRFRVRTAEGQRFSAEIAIADQTFAVTGPVRVTYLIDGRRLGSIHCDHPGKFEIDEPVDPGLLRPGQYIHVTFEADKQWIAPEDGAQLSFLLFRAGFHR